MTDKPLFVFFDDTFGQWRVKIPHTDMEVICENGKEAEEVCTEQNSAALSWAGEREQKLVEVLINAERKLSAYIGICKGDKELTDSILPSIRSAISIADSRRPPSDGEGKEG